MLDRVVKTILLLFVFSVSISQEINVKSGFKQDSLGIGEAVNYWVTIEYPLSVEVLLADSTAVFTPFEFVEKKYYETEIREGQAFDSVVYTFQSFEIDPVQRLEVALYLFQNGDSMSINSPVDSIYFQELAPVVTDTTSLRSNYEYQVVPKAFNFSLWGIIIIALATISMALLWIFGGRIRRYFLLKKMKKEYTAFSELFASYQSRISKEPRPALIEEAMSEWKKYTEKLEKEPFRKLTTTEILKYPFTSEIKEALKQTDRAVYGGRTGSEINRSLQLIEDFTNHRYSLKKSEVKNG